MANKTPSLTERILMTNFEKFISEFTQEKFIDMMCLNCDSCPAYPCKENPDDMPVYGSECEEALKEWCEKASD